MHLIMSAFGNKEIFLIFSFQIYCVIYSLFILIDANVKTKSIRRPILYFYFEVFSYC